MGDLEIAACDAWLTREGRFDKLLAMQGAVEILPGGFPIFRHRLVFQHILADFDFHPVNGFHHCGMGSVETGIAIQPVKREDRHGGAFQDGVQGGVVLL